MKLSKAEKEARAKYLREWRAKNKDKVAAQNARYWKKKANKTALYSPCIICIDCKNEFKSGSKCPNCKSKNLRVKYQ